MSTHRKMSRRTWLKGMAVCSAAAMLASMAAQAKAHKAAVRDLAADFDGSLDAWCRFFSLQTEPCTLTVPPGYFSGQRLASVGFNGTIIGAGAGVSSLEAGVTFNSGIPEGQGIVWPKIATATAGQNYAQLLTISDASNYTAGNWSLLTAWTMQVGGYPQNVYFFEWIKIANVDAATGVITFDRPIRNTYKATYPPLLEGGGSVDGGGRATLFPCHDADIFRVLPPDFTAPWPTVMPSTFDQSITIRNCTLVSSTHSGNFVSNGACREVLFEDCTFVDAPVPTASVSWTARRCIIPSSVEVDKLVETVTFDDCTFNGDIDVQSASVDCLVVTGCTGASHGVVGTPKKALIENSTLSTLRIGPGGFGQASELTVSNCTISNNDPIGGRLYLLSNVTSITNGIITIPITKAFFGDPGGTGGPASEQITPGGWHFLKDDTIPTTTLFAFTVTDVTYDATNWYIHTSIPQPNPYSTIATSIVPHPCTSVTVTGTGGCSEMRVLSLAPAGKPLYSYYNTGTWNGISITGLGVGESSFLWGNIVSIKVNIITPYTGAKSLQLRLLRQNGETRLLNPSFAYVTYAPAININIAGLRVITPGSTVGAQTGDSGLDLAAGNNWIGNSDSKVFAFMHDFGTGSGADISDEDPSLWPELTIEIITDQGITPLKI
jgi:hypothetical protein